MLTREFKVETFDVNPDGVMKISALQRYFQQIARDDCTNLGASYDYLRGRGIVFVLIKLKIDIDALPSCDDILTLKSWSERIDALTFYRAFEVYRGGKKLISAISSWVLMDYEKRIPVRSSAIGIELEQLLLLDKPRLPRRVLPEGETRHAEHTVLYSELDQNNHLNNCCYTDILYDSIPELRGRTPRSVMLIYQSECREGELMALEYSVGETECRVKVTNGEKESFEAGFEF